MKRIIISITFLVLFLPLIIIGVLDYQLSKHGISYKSRNINLKKSEIEFFEVKLQRKNLNVRAARVDLKFDITKPSEMSIHVKNLQEKLSGTQAKGIDVKASKFYTVLDCSIKKVYLKKYDLDFENIKILKKFSIVKGSFNIDSTIKVSKFFDLQNAQVVKDAFFKETDRVRFKDPVNFNFDLSVFPVYKINTTNVEIGSVNFKKVKFGVHSLKDKTYRAMSGFYLNDKSNFQINGTIVNVNPFSAKFKMILENINFFDDLLSKKYSKNKIYNAVSKFFNINVGNIVRSFDFNVEKGRFSISL